MNNSFIAIENIEDEDEVEDVSPVLRQRQTELLKIIEALTKISNSNEWKALQELIFDGLETGLEKRLKSESTKNELNTPEIYRLNGELKWAKRYSDLGRLIEAYRTELTNITKQLNENANHRTTGS